MKFKLSFLILVTTLFVLQGCSTTFSKGADRRTEGSYIGDRTIVETATTRIKNKYLDKAHVSVNSYNRKVLVTGEVTDEAIKTDITRIIGGVQDVTAITNELTIAPATGFSPRSGDSLTTNNVKFRLRDGGKDFKSERVEVVTENGVVYLLGLVTHSEGDIAKEITSTSSGVKKVVPLFEYID